MYVEGRLETRKWTDKNGVDRYTTEVIATDMKMLGSRPGSGSDSFDSSGRDEHESGPKQSSPNRSNTGFDDMEDDIPF